MPSFRQGRYIEASIQSVLDQRYPDLEFFVIDGGSDDETVSVLQRYSDRLTGWTSERDRGQSHAINKGLARSTGVLFNWLNSDDRLRPGALAAVARAWDAAAPDVIVGACDVVDMKTRRKLHCFEPRPPRRLASFFKSGGIVMGQSSTFVSTAVMRRVNGVREDLSCVMDWDLYLRITRERGDALTTIALPEVLSELSDHPDTKTQQQAARFRQEAIAVLSALEPALGREDRRALQPWLNNLKAQEQVARTLESQDGGQGRRLLELLVKQPSVLLSRFYWGAWKRVCETDRCRP
jgi:hypothetical protein